MQNDPIQIVLLEILHYWIIITAFFFSFLKLKGDNSACYD